MKKVLLLNGESVTPVKVREEWDILSAPRPFIPAISPTRKIKNALLNPDGTYPLPDLLRRSRKVVVAFDDISVPFPPMISDIRKTVLDEVLKLILQAGIDRKNVTLLCATGLHRRCTPSEVRHMIGKKVWKGWIDRLNFHREQDAVWIGDTEKGERVEINRHLLEADLVIYISIVFLPMNGGWKSIAVGTGSFTTILESHNPDILISNSYMDTESEFHAIIKRMGKVIKNKINLFKIELVLSNIFLPPVDISLKNIAAKIPVAWDFYNNLPRIARYKTFQSIRSWYPLYEVFAGDVDTIHEKAIKEVKKQLSIYTPKKFDAVLFGLPSLSPYSVNSQTNPVLIHTMVSGYIYSLFKKAIKNGGVLIFWNPLEEVFDLDKHYPYVYLYNNHLPMECERRKDLEEFYWKNREFYHLYNNGYGYHGAHAILAWYWGCPGKVNTSAQIAIGGNPNVAEKLGMIAVNNVSEALEEAAKRTSITQIGLFLFLPIFLIG